VKTVDAQQHHSHTVLLGGTGGDSHSVGLTILRQALTGNGYRVRYIGTQNQIEEFFRLAGFCNVVMVSSMDGHARYYLQRFPELMRQFQSASTLWYLGGNLHIGDSVGRERQFVEMGFDRVFTSFVDLTTVLEVLARDLHDIPAVADCPTLWEHARTGGRLLPSAAPDNLLDPHSFGRARLEVLDQWKTGRSAKDLDENAEFLGAQPSLAQAQELVNEGRAPMLIQPRCGVPLLDEQIKLFKAFKGLGVRVLSYQVDSLTRNNNYAGAEEAIKESAAAGASTLNGFPIVNHGVAELRRVAREVGVPLQSRHSTRDPRLLAEISYAGGITSFEGGAICYNIPYYKDYPLDESVRAWQYVDRLTGLYHERYGIVLDREFFGTLTATLIPPSLAIVTDIIEALLAVRQGVRCVSLGYAEQGHRAQDVAAVRMLGCLARELLGNLGHEGVRVSTVFHQYMAAFPPSTERSAELIYESAITAALSGATRVIGKTPAEAFKIPMLADNIAGLDLIKRGIAAAADNGHAPDEARIAEECALIRREVEAIFDSVLFCGGGDLAQGVVNAFAKGLLDVPFSPSVHNRGAVITARDTEGAVRYFSCGELQFDRELRQFHEEKAAERRRAEGLASARCDHLIVERDVMRVARGRYERWPLHR
jgi:methylaspartate mutase epsilon subunit